MSIVVTNLRVLKRSRVRPVAGDVFAMGLPNGTYLFGLVAFDHRREPRSAGWRPSLFLRRAPRDVAVRHAVRYRVPLPQALADLDHRGLGVGSPGRGVAFVDLAANGPDHFDDKEPVIGVCGLVGQQQSVCERFGLQGTPLRIELRSGSNPYAPKTPR